MLSRPRHSNFVTTKKSVFNLFYRLSETGISDWEYLWRLGVARLYA